MKQSINVYLDIEKVQEPVEQTVLQVKDLQKELLVLRLAFGQLKAAVATAAEPFQAVLAPALTDAVRGTTRLVKTLGQAAGQLLGVEVIQKKVEKKVVSTGKALKRTVAGFDQLNRLQGDTGGSRVQTTAVPVPGATVSQEAQALADKIRSILLPLAEFDLGPLRWTFGQLKMQLERFAAGAAEALGQLWQQHLAPFLGWVTEALIPVLMNLGSGAFAFLSVALGDVAAGFSQMLEDMRPLTEFVGKVVLTVFDQLRRVLAEARISAEQESTALGDLFRSIGQAAAVLWEKLGPALEGLRVVFANTFRSIGTTVMNIMGYVLDTVGGAIRVLAGILSGDWQMVWSGMTQVCKGAVNSIIGVLNVLLSGLTGALNGVFKLLNRISIDVPDWVPGLGGRTFGFKLKTLNAPQIPYLAKGAVLPANRPCLAMVGDQKHGTNVEAPLTTIQEAVAQVLAGQLEGMTEGFDATVQELRQLRSAVADIQVGDAVIGRAAQRYAAAQATLYGR